MLIAKACSSLALKIDHERLVDLAERLVRKEWTEYETERVLDHLVESPEVSKQIRIYGTIVPADFVAAYQECFGGTPEVMHARRRQAERRQAEQDAMPRLEGTPVQVPLPRLATKAERDRRLQQGSTSHKPGTPEYEAAWSDYFDRPDVQEAQEVARQRLAEARRGEGQEDAA